MPIYRGPISEVRAEKSLGPMKILVGGQALRGDPFRWRDPGADGTADAAAAPALADRVLGVGEDWSTGEAAERRLLPRGIAGSSRGRMGPCVQSFDL
jgi:hypothetical protein